MLKGLLANLLTYMYSDIHAWLSVFIGAHDPWGVGAHPGSESAGGGGRGGTDHRIEPARGATPRNAP